MPVKYESEFGNRLSHLGKDPNRMEQSVRLANSGENKISITFLIKTCYSKT